MYVGALERETATTLLYCCCCDAAVLYRYRYILAAKFVLACAGTLEIRFDTVCWFVFNL